MQTDGVKSDCDAHPPETDLVEFGEWANAAVSSLSFFLKKEKILSKRS